MSVVDDKGYEYPVAPELLAVCPTVLVKLLCLSKTWCVLFAGVEMVGNELMFNPAVMQLNSRSGLLSNSDLKFGTTQSVRFSVSLVSGTT